MRDFLIILLLSYILGRLLISCSHEPPAPDFETIHGLAVFSKGLVTKFEIETATEELLRYFPPIETLAPAQVRVCTGQCRCASGDECEGRYLPRSYKDTIEYTHRECIADSLFAHELLHVVEAILKRDYASTEYGRNATEESEDTVRENICGWSQ